MAIYFASVKTRPRSSAPCPTRSPTFIWRTSGPTGFTSTSTPGKGAIDFRSIFAALREIRYAGWVTVELYPYETTAAGVAKQAFEHLKPLLSEA